MSTKSKTESEFSRVSFPFSRFSGKSIRPDLWNSGKRRKFEKIEKTAFTNPTFFLFKIRIPLEAMCCKNYGRLHRRKSQIKPHKQ